MTAEHVVVDRGGVRGPFYDPLVRIERAKIEGIRVLRGLRYPSLEGIPVINRMPLSSLAPGTRLRIDVPPTRFETELRSVDPDGNSVVVAGEWWQPGATNRRLALSDIRGIEYQNGVRRGAGALRGFCLGLLVDVIGYWMVWESTDWGESTPIGYAGLFVPVLAGVAIGLAAAPADWRPVELGPAAQSTPGSSARRIRAVATSREPL